MTVASVEKHKYAAVMSILNSDFYTRNTKTVAKELLGKKLVHIYRGQRLSGIITEVEAYLGVEDKACHSFEGRRTLRTETMYLEGGHAYVYFIYGKYNCVNVVTQKRNVPEAVLIRALEPVEGISIMKKNRSKKELYQLTTGPGKLTQALSITKSLNGIPLVSKNLFIEPFLKIPKSAIVTKPRIGVDYAGDHANWPLRYYIKNNIYISKS